MKDTYAYPAIFKKEKNGGMAISFPDLPGCLSSINSNESLEDGINNAREAMALWLHDETNIPKASSLENIKIDTHQFLVYVEVWMPYWSKGIVEHYVKKTLSIPSWLNELAIMHNLNFSLVLKDALKEKLNIK
jgi:predicted RNase H-like HicB family nuclease